MKKLIAFVLTLVLALSVATVAFANPGQNPNRNPGAPSIQVCPTYSVRVTGGGNNLVIEVLRNGVVVYSPRRAGNGTFTQEFSFNNRTFLIRVQGNSLVNASAVASRYVADEYSFYRFVRLNQIGSRFDGKTEISETRNFNAISSHTARQHHLNDCQIVNPPGTPNSNRVTGQGAKITDLTATATLRFQYHHNYVEQFQRIYEWVDVTVWSDGERDEVVRPNSEHVKGVVDGKEYTGQQRDGSNVFQFAYTGNIILHMGQGQGLPHVRTLSFGIENAPISVTVTLLNTGSTPGVAVAVTPSNVAGLPNGLQ